MKIQKAAACWTYNYDDNDNHVNNHEHNDYDDHVNVNQVLTIGDTTYINDERYAIEKPIRHDVSWRH